MRLDFEFVIQHAVFPHEGVGGFNRSAHSAWPQEGLVSKATLFACDGSNNPGTWHPDFTDPLCGDQRCATLAEQWKGISFAQWEDDVS